LTNSLVRAGVAAGATLLAASALVATADTAHAADTSVVVVKVVDQFGQPAAVAVQAYDSTGASYYDGPGGGATPPVTSTHTFTSLPADGYSFLSIGPWSGIECFGVTPCNISGGSAFTPVVTVADGGTASYTMHVTMPSITGEPAVGAPLSIKTPTGYQMMAPLVEAQSHQSSAFTQQWVRGASDLAGQTSTAYTTVPADGGKQVAARLLPSPGVLAIFGAAGYGVPPYTTHPVTVSKNATKTRASVVRGVIRVNVKAQGAKPDGKVKVTVGSFTAKAKLKKGKVRVALPQNLKPGTYTLKVKYLGSAAFEKSKSKKVKVTIR
jgi:hypothetical protein